MTHTELLDELKTAGIPAFLLAAPAGLTRYAVISPYAVNSLRGDDQILLQIEKVQIDIVCQSTLDTIVPDVKAVLSAEWLVWDEPEHMAFDEEFNGLRTILQLELV